MAGVVERLGASEETTAVLCESSSSEEEGEVGPLLDQSSSLVSFAAATAVYRQPSVSPFSKPLFLTAWSPTDTAGCGSAVLVL